MTAPTLTYEPRLAPGSLILVTGVNGLIASHTADQALLAGYRVRGSVRSVSKAAWMQDFFDSRHGKDKFELVQVPDISKEGAFDEAVKGVAGVAHIASVLGSYIPEEAIGGSVDTNLTLLKSAAKVSSVKAVTITSSSMSQYTQTPNKKWTISQDTWNEDALSHAYDKPYKQENLWTVYAASKVVGEREAWKFVEENKLSFTFNTVLPSANFGAVLSPENQGTPSTTGWLSDLFKGNINIQPMIPPQYFVDNQDTGRLHLAALIDPSAQNERILAYAEPYTWNGILKIFRKGYPDRKFVDDLPDQGEELAVVKNEKSAQLLKRMGRDAFTRLDDSLKLVVQDLI